MTPPVNHGLPCPSPPLSSPPQADPVSAYSQNFFSQSNPNDQTSSIHHLPISFLPHSPAPIAKNPDQLWQLFEANHHLMTQIEIRKILEALLLLEQNNPTLAVFNHPAIKKLEQYILQYVGQFDETDISLACSALSKTSLPVDLDLFPRILERIETIKLSTFTHKTLCFTISSLCQAERLSEKLFHQFLLEIRLRPIHEFTLKELTLVWKVFYRNLNRTGWDIYKKVIELISHRNLNGETSTFFTSIFDFTLIHYSHRYPSKQREVFPLIKPFVKVVLHRKFDFISSFSTEELILCLHAFNSYVYTDLSLFPLFIYELKRRKFDDFSSSDIMQLFNVFSSKAPKDAVLFELLIKEAMKCCSKQQLHRILCIIDEHPHIKAVYDPLYKQLHEIVFNSS